MNTLKMIAATSLGIAAGAVLGILTAPRSGKKTRKLISDEVSTQVSTLENEAEKKFNHLRDSYSENLKKITENGKSVLDKTKEAVSLN